MKRIWILLLLVWSLHAEEGAKKVVYDLSTDSIGKFTRNILTGIVFQKGYYEAKMEELNVIVVVHGEAYRFFLNSLEGTKFSTDQKLVQEHSALLKRLESLHKNYGVAFRVCQAGLSRHNLDPSQVVRYATLVPSATTALIDAQNDGYAYIPTH